MPTDVRQMKITSAAILGHAGVVLIVFEIHRKRRKMLKRARDRDVPSEE